MACRWAAGLADVQWDGPERQQQPMRGLPDEVMDSLGLSLVALGMHVLGAGPAPESGSELSPSLGIN